MARVRKYQPGAVVPSLDAMAAAWREGKYLMFHHKPIHPGFLSGMPLGMLMHTVRQREWHYANINPEWTPPKEIDQ